MSYLAVVSTKLGPGAYKRSPISVTVLPMVYIYIYMAVVGVIDSHNLLYITQCLGYIYLLYPRRQVAEPEPCHTTVCKPSRFYPVTYLHSR